MKELISYKDPTLKQKSEAFDFKSKVLRTFPKGKTAKPKFYKFRKEDRAHLTDEMMKCLFY